MAAKPDIMKFRFAEMFSDSQTGKTSVTKVSGAFLIMAGAIAFLYCVFFIKEVDRLNIILIQSLGVMTLGSGLIAAKVFKPEKPLQETEQTTETEVETTT